MKITIETQQIEGAATSLWLKKVNLQHYQFQIIEKLPREPYEASSVLQDWPFLSLWIHIEHKIISKKSHTFTWAGFCYQLVETGTADTGFIAFGKMLFHCNRNYSGGAPARWRKAAGKRFPTLRTGYGFSVSGCMIDGMCHKLNIGLWLKCSQLHSHCLAQRFLPSV